MLSNGPDRFAEQFRFEAAHFLPNVPEGHKCARLHGHSFRLLHPLDDGWEPYWLDTVQVPESRTVRIAFVADNPGKWLLASTVMERFDAGLWTWIAVT